MTYSLTVIKKEKNPKYSPARNAYDRSTEEPEFIVFDTCLVVDLTEEEFQAAKKAIIEVIK